MVVVAGDIKSIFRHPLKKRSANHKSTEISIIHCGVSRYRPLALRYIAALHTQGLLYPALTTSTSFSLNHTTMALRESLQEV